MVDQFGLSRGGGDLGQGGRIGQHVDQGGFPDIRAADKGKLEPIVGWTLRELLAAAAKYGGGDVHA